jgi:urea transporter
MFCAVAAFVAACAGGAVAAWGCHHAELLARCLSQASVDAATGTAAVSVEQALRNKM